MVQPLALFLYEKLLPSGQLVNRFQDKGYRVQSIGDPTTLVEHAEREKPLVVVADLESRQHNVSQAIGELKKIPAQHIFRSSPLPLPRKPPCPQEDGRTAGAVSWL